MRREKCKFLLILQLYSCISIFASFSYLITYLLVNAPASQCTPTVKPYDKFNLEKDIETLHHIARKEPRYTPDTDKVVRMLCHRSREQRRQMKKAFKEKYNVDIDRYLQVEGEISYGELVEDSFRSVMGVYKHHLNWELTDKLKRTDKLSIVEILLSIPPEEKEKFFIAYNETFKSGLRADIEKLVQEGDFYNIVVEMVNRTRKADIPPDKIDWELAKKDAKCVHDERKKWNNHRQEIDRVLMETAFQQLNATFIEFKKIAGKEIEEVITHKMQKDKRAVYKALVFFVKDKIDYYARRIEKAMEGWGTQDHVINRIVGIHCESDLTEIATAFKLNTADSLIDALKSETVIHHEMFLTCLAGQPTLKENF